MPEQGKEPRLLHEQHLGRLDGPGLGGVTVRSDERHLGEGVAGPEDVDDLLFAGRVDPVDVHRAALDKIETGRRVAFVEKVAAFVERLAADQRGDRLEVGHGQSAEELARAERVDDGGVLQRFGGGGHRCDVTERPAK